jgi:hypothetical protein
LAVLPTIGLLAIIATVTLAAFTARVLRPRCLGTHPGAHSGFPARATKEALLGLFHYFDFGFGLVYSKAIQCNALCVFNCLGSRFYPFHGVSFAG